ncbi:MAG: glutamyl-Q tRNA(Asp) synthetase [Gammaproteobacteria bacterium]|jgi:glutamyl-Q tRNA(Asp) synthetase
MPVIGRFAPSPSGPLHFGSLVAAMGSYCQARAQNGQWILRIEDVDTPRVVPTASDQILQDLETFGFYWDGPVFYQSQNFEQYQFYLDELIGNELAYACRCSRKQLRDGGAEYGPLGQIYPGFCRDEQLLINNHSIRLMTKNASKITFVDPVYGSVNLDIPIDIGDVVLKRVDQIYAYHLAVVVDDHLQGITEVVRGEDLLNNTPLHIYLQNRLEFQTPDYLHLPLVNNADGVKLSKQTGAAALDKTKVSKQLIAALDHLGQQTNELEDKMRPCDILSFAVSNWCVSKINAS